MLEQFRTLLRDVSAHPHKQLASLSLSSAEEQQQLRAAFLDDLEAE
jgi:hypothetical protein